MNTSKQSRRKQRSLVEQEHAASARAGWRSRRLWLSTAALGLIVVVAGAWRLGTSSPATEASASPNHDLTPTVIMHKQRGCACCERWAEHLHEAGFNVEIRTSDDLTTLKSRLGVPDAAASCHTATVGDYFIEGHVPVADIQRLLRERPQARGLALPGMPLGSPGMEVASGQRNAFKVLLVGSPEDLEVYSEHAEASADPAAHETAAHH